MITMISIFSEAKQPDRNNQKNTKLSTCSDDVHTIVHVHMVADMTRFYCLTLAEGNKMTSALKSFKYYMFLRLTIMHIYECVNNVIYSQLCIF
jgi:hypothetical protein